MDSDSEWEYESRLISLITQLIYSEDLLLYTSLELDWVSLSLIVQIIHHIKSMDLDSLTKPESKLMSLVTQAISLFNSLDLDSQPKPLLRLISFISRFFNSSDSDSDWESKQKKLLLLDQTSKLEPEPELMSLVRQMLWLVISMNPKWEKLISLAPQLRVKFKDGKFHGVKEDLGRSSNKWECLPFNWEKFGLRKEEEATHFLCRGCYGKFHEEEYEKALVEIKHSLHPKHSLQLVLFEEEGRTRDCYCCDEDLKKIFYYCYACDFSMNIACVEKQHVLSIDHPKWHEHTLAHFPRQVSLTCDLCASADSISPFYICLLCDFVVHQSCLSLPRVIRISRHPHRICFTPFFDQGDFSCSICRRKMGNHYGGYSCIKEECSFAAHSRCATQRNVCDGIDLEGEPEEIEEDEVEPFVRISDGIIQHFSHQHHHLRLDENMARDYDEDKLCQACTMPIYFGNFYSCMQCNFILHEACANLSRKIYHPIHPHMLTLSPVRGKVDFLEDESKCSACQWICVAGFLYVCDKEECLFQLHVNCATISEPLVNESHMHPLFLTSVPGEERRICSVCKGFEYSPTNESFNCIEYKCDFAFCFGCAIIPQKVRYKHDKHMLTLSYGDEEKSTMTYWCEVCEGRINPNERFYTCDGDCSVALHVTCLIGMELYMMPGSSWVLGGRTVKVLPNNHHMSRPICSYCKKRCPYKLVFQFSGSVFCSEICLSYVFM